MPRLFDGSRFSIALLGSAASVIVLILFGSLVLSGQLPPRGLVSGDVRAGLGGPLVGQSVIFERIDGSDVVTVRTDAHGHFSATLTPGQYYIDMVIAACPRIGSCEPRRAFYPFGLKIFTIAAGQHLEAQLATCGEIWQCQRPTVP